MEYFPPSLVIMSAVQQFPILLTLFRTRGLISPAGSRWTDRTVIWLK
jgi:hypothetical protein